MVAIFSAIGTVSRYGGHTNVPSKAKLGTDMAALGLAVVQFDLAGHGYSEGERAYIKRYSDWLDDYFQVRAEDGGVRYSLRLLQ